MVRVLAPGAHQCKLLLLGPGLLFDARVEMVVPPGGRQVQQAREGRDS